MSYDHESNSFGKFGVRRFSGMFSRRIWIIFYNFRVFWKKCHFQYLEQFRAYCVSSEIYGLLLLHFSQILERFVFPSTQTVCDVMQSCHDHWSNPLTLRNTFYMHSDVMWPLDCKENNKKVASMVLIKSFFWKGFQLSFDSPLHFSQIS